MMSSNMQYACLKIDFNDHRYKSFRSVRSNLAIEMQYAWNRLFKLAQK